MADSETRTASPSLFKRVSSPFHPEKVEHDYEKEAHQWRPGGDMHNPDLGDSYSIGDVEEKYVTDHITGEERKLLFALTKWPKTSLNLPVVSLGKKDAKDTKEEKPKKDDKKKDKRPKPVRKVFIAFKIKRVSDIDNIEEHFKLKFHIYFNWLPTHVEYLSYCEAAKNRDTGALLKWEPAWYPHLEYLNQITKLKQEWERYPETGCFRMLRMKGFFNTCCDDDMVYDPVAKDDDGEPVSLGRWSDDRAYFIRAKLEIELLLSEELELQAFPFDCQDLSVVMREETRDMRIVFLPEMRKVHFGSIDPRYSVIGEWDMESARIEFGSTNPNSSRAGTAYPTMILRLKMQRRWKVFMWNVVLVMMCIEFLTLTAFKLDIEAGESADRMNLCMIMVLTAIAFLQVVSAKLPNLPYLSFIDWYIYGSYIFLVAVMVETAIMHALFVHDESGDFQANEVDMGFFYFSLTYLFVYHIVFAIWGFYQRAEEKAKLVMDSDQIDAEVAQSRPILQFDNRKAQRTGDGNRLLFFKAYKKP